MTEIKGINNNRIIFEAPSPSSVFQNGGKVQGTVLDKNGKGTRLWLIDREVQIPSNIPIMENVGDRAEFVVEKNTRKNLQLKYITPQPNDLQTPSQQGKIAEVIRNYGETVNGFMAQLSESDQSYLETNLLKIEDALKTIASQMTDKDLDQVAADGFDPKKMSVETLARVITHNKQAVKYHDVGAISQGLDKAAQDLQELYGDEERLKSVASALERENLPLRKQHIDRILQGMTTVDTVKEMSSETALKVHTQLAESNGSITLDQAYKQISGPMPPVVLQGISEDDLTAMVKNRLVDIGMSASNENVAAAKALVMRQIPVTSEAVGHYIGSEKPEIDESAMINAMAKAISEEGTPGQVLVLAGEEQNIYAQLLAEDGSRQEGHYNTIDLLGKVTEAHIAKAIELGTDDTLKGITAQVGSETDFKTLGPQETSDLRMLQRRRQVEEIRLKMTTEAAMRLEHKGIDIDTAPIEKVVQSLREEESAMIEAQVKAYGKDLSSTEAEQAKVSIEGISELALRHPDTEIRFMEGDLSQTLGNVRQISSEMIYHESLASDSQRAAGSYDSAMTEVRRDLGDRIENTFDQIDDILADLDMPVTEANNRAVQALGRNGMSINEANILQLQTIQEKIDQITGRMTPGIVVNMVQSGINPMNLSVDELMAYVDSLAQSTGESAEEKISRMIYDMDRAGQLSDNERQSLMGIYRALDTVVRSQGAAAGFLVKNDRQLTVNQLFEAAKYLKSTGGIRPGITADVNDSFGPLDSLRGSEASIRNQVESAIANIAKEGYTVRLTQVESLVRQDMVPDATMVLKKELMEIRIGDFIGQISESHALVIAEDRSEGLKEMPLEALTNLMKQWPKGSISENSQRYLAMVSAKPEVLQHMAEHRMPMTLENFEKVMAQNSNIFELMDDLEALVRNIADESLRSDVIQKLRQASEQVLRGEVTYDSLEETMEEIESLIRNSGSEEGAPVYRHAQNAVKTINHTQMIQVTEDYFQIPVLMDGQVHQLNMMFFNEDGRSGDTTREMKVLMSFDTTNLGRVQAMMTLDGNQAAINISTQNDEDRTYLAGFQSAFEQVIRDSNFTLAEISYEPLDVKEAVEIPETQVARPMVTTDDKGHIDWSV